MQTCVICGEQFEEVEKTCPVCGARASAVTLEQLAFPDEICQSYALEQILEGSGKEPAYLLKNRADGSMAIGKILPEGVEAQPLIRILNNLSQTEVPGIPKIFGIWPEDGIMHGAYLYEAVEGETLYALVERENPIEPESVTRIHTQMNALIAQMHGAGFEHGDLNLHSFRLTKNGIELADFGAGTKDGADEDRADQIAFRLGRGRWPEEGESVKENLFAPPVKASAEEDSDNDLKLIAQGVIAVALIVAIAVIAVLLIKLG